MSQGQSDKPDACPRCKGKGHCPVEDGMEGDVMNCPDCDGTGEAEETMDDAERYAMGAM